MIRAFLFLAFLALPAGAQDQEVVIRTEMAISTDIGAQMRGLDRINGETTDFEVPMDGGFQYQRLKITLKDCRYPEGQKNTEAYAYLEITDVYSEKLAFEGWMFASSPALSALDHPRYDVWVVRCKT